MNSVDDIDYCRFYLNECAKLNKWREGALFIKSLPEDLQSVRESWIARHIQACAKIEVEFHANFSSYHAIRERLSFLSSNTVEKTRPLSGGKVNLGLYRHQVKDDETGVVHSVMEKIYHPAYRASFAEETRLMEKIGSTALCTPDYFGQQKVGEFHCIYYRHIRGKHLSEGKFEDIKPKLVSTLWLTNAELVAKPDVIAEVRAEFIEFFDESKVQLLEKAARTHILSLKGRKARTLIDKALASALTLPVFVLHGDLYKGNVLREQRSGEHFIIDWDKWRVALVGDGLSFENLALDQSLSDLVTNQVAQQDISRDDLLGSIMLHDLKFHCEQANFARIGEWLTFFEKH